MRKPGVDAATAAQCNMEYEGVARGDTQRRRQILEGLLGAVAGACAGGWAGVDGMPLIKLQLMPQRHRIEYARRRGAQCERLPLLRRDHGFDLIELGALVVQLGVRLHGRPENTTEHLVLVFDRLGVQVIAERLLQVVDVTAKGEGEGGGDSNVTQEPAKSARRHARWQRGRAHPLTVSSFSWNESAVSILVIRQ